MGVMQWTVMCAVGLYEGGGVLQVVKMLKCRRCV